MSLLDKPLDRVTESGCSFGSMGDSPRRKPEQCGCAEGVGGVCPACWRFKQDRLDSSHSVNCERPGCDGTGLITRMHQSCGYCRRDDCHEGV